MDIKSQLLFVHNLLEDENIPHALIGGLALGAYGVQRFTNDVDFMVNNDDREAVRIAFLKRGYSVYFESPEVLQFDGPIHVDILFANRPLSKQMIVDAKEIPGFRVKCVSIEGIIGLKIQAYCNAPKRSFQDKADILALVEKHADLDWDLVKQYADIFGQWPEIEKIKSMARKA